MAKRSHATHSHSSDEAGPPPAPFFEASDEAGHMHRLTGYRGAPLMLCFFSRDDAEAPHAFHGDFGEAFPGYRKKGGFILGVLRGTPKSVGRFKARHLVPFPILADADGSIARAYGVPEGRGGHIVAMAGIDAEGRLKLEVKHRSNPRRLAELAKRM